MELRNLIAKALREQKWDHVDSTPGEYADAILAALDAAGLVVVPRDIDVELPEWDCPDTSQSYWEKCLSVVGSK